MLYFRLELSYSSVVVYICAAAAAIAAYGQFFRITLHVLHNTDRSLKVHLMQLHILRVLTIHFLRSSFYSLFSSLTFDDVLYSTHAHQNFTNFTVFRLVYVCKNMFCCIRKSNYIEIGNRVLIFLNGNYFLHMIWFFSQQKLLNQLFI